MNQLLLLLGLVLSINTARAQGVWTKAFTTWAYDPGTNTGIGQTGGAAYSASPGTTVTTANGMQGYMPYAPSGSIALNNIATGTAQWSLTGVSPLAKVRYVSSNGGKVSKLSAYNIDNASSVASVFYTIEFNNNTATALDWRFAIGKGTTHLTNTSGLPGTASTVSFPTIFSTVRWNLPSAGTNLNFTYSAKTTNDAATVTEHALSGLTFSKGGIYNMEFYCNNSTIIQDYIRGDSSYAVPAHTMHIWANGVRLTSGSSFDIPGMQLSMDEVLDGIAFQGATSTPAGSSEMLLSNLRLNYEVSPLGEDDDDGVVADTILPVVALDMARVNQIATLLPLTAKGLGEPYQNRTMWDSLRLSGNYNALITRANLNNTATLPAITDSIYLAYFTAGDSQTAKTIMTERRWFLSALVWAECLKNDGTYTNKISSVINDLIDQKSWNFPSEDRAKKNFYGTQYTIALSAASYGHELAQALYLLNDKLSNTLRQRIIDALYLRVFNPTLQGISNGNANGEFTALTSAGNHNPACLSGVTGAALAAIADRAERAKFVAIAERYSKNAIAGFLADGYCTEGMRYYNFGFLHFICLRESLLQSTAQDTSTQIDLFDHPKMDKIATYGPNIEIINNIYPSIADSGIDDKPSSSLMFYINRNLQLGLSEYVNYSHRGNSNTTVADVMWAFPNSASLTAPSPIQAPSIGLRSYFNVAGVLTVRPEPNTILNMGASIKGGNNHELHNHNDIGSYTIACGKVRIMGDPGAIPYTAKVFNSERYTYKTLNSYGHPVPVVDNKLQRLGANAKAEIVSTNFTPQEDKMVMNIRSAYEVPQLTKLLRTFSFNRTDTGFVEVRDEFEFSTAKNFETAIITRSDWQLISPSVIELQNGSQRLRIDIKVPSGLLFNIVTDTISEEGSEPYKRIGIKLTNPAVAGYISLVYRKPGFSPILTGNWNKTTVQWAYNPGTDTGTGQLGGAPFVQTTTANVTTSGSTQGFMPYPVSGSVKLGGITDGAGKGKWWLTGTGQYPAIRFASSNGGKVAKMAMYDISTASAITKIQFKLTFNDSTTTDCNWQFAIGKTAGTTSNSNLIYGSGGIVGSGTTSNPEIFSAVKWLMSGGVYTFSYRTKANPTATVAFNNINTGFFIKGGTYNMEFYCNSSSASEQYTKGNTVYTVPARTYHIWANDIQLTYSGSADFPANELPVNAVVDGMVFTGQTSISSGTNDLSAEMRLSDIAVNSVQTTLPLMLTSFSGESEKGSVILKWKTASEHDDEKFHVLRTQNPLADFNIVGTIAKTGTSAKGSEYTFTDGHPSSGFNYYKLRQTNKNGEQAESPVVVVSAEAENRFSIFVDQSERVKASIFTTTPGKALISITDVLGRKITEGYFELPEGYSEFDLHAPYLAKGVYVGNLLIGEKRSSIKFIK